jgi:hypothetical protein
MSSLLVFGIRRDFGLHQVETTLGAADHSTLYKHISP